MPEPSAPGAAVVLLSKVEAKRLTGKIKRHADELWRLLAEAHDGEAWRALGYTSWAVYVATEFDISRSESYRLLQQAKVIRALTESAGLSRARDTSAREAAAVEPHLPKVQKAIAKKVAALPPGVPDAAREAVVSAAVAKVTRPPLHPVASAPPRRVPLAERMDALSDALRDVTGFDPVKAAAAIPPEEAVAVERAAAWLGRVAKAVAASPGQQATRRSGRDDVTPNFKK